MKKLFGTTQSALLVLLLAIFCLAVFAPSTSAYDPYDSRVIRADDVPWNERGGGQDETPWVDDYSWNDRNGTQNRADETPWTESDGDRNQPPKADNLLELFWMVFGTLFTAH